MVRLALKHLFQEVVGDLLLIAGQTGGHRRRHRARPRSASVASATAAAQPSVRSHRAPAAACDNSSPALAATSRVSIGSRARSAVPISNRSPLARSRPSGTPGSPRVTNTN